jgi:hypothetical protein
MQMGSAWDDEIRISAGGPRLMEKFGEARVLLFASKETVEKGAGWDHAEYQPHITISYDDDAPELATVEP